MASGCECPVSSMVSVVLPLVGVQQGMCAPVSSFHSTLLLSVLYSRHGHSPIVIYIQKQASQPAAVATGGSAVAAAGRVAVAEQGWVVVVVVVTVMRNLGDGLRRNQPSRCSVPSRPYQALVPAAATGKGGSLVSPPRGGRQGLPIRAFFPPPRTSSCFALC